MDSILNSVKKKLGIASEYTQFDDGDLIDHINSTFMVLNQLGVGGKEPFFITGPDEKWSDFSSDIDKLQMVKTYVGLKVKLMFDPPQSSAHIDTIKNLISELEWRLNVAVDSEEET